MFARLNLHRRALWLLLSVGFCATALASGWTQWGAGPAHENSSTASGQPLDFTLADVVYDPFAPQEWDNSGGNLYVHFQAPIVDGADVFMTFKSGSYSDALHWESQVWNVKRLNWSQNQLGEIWSMASDWKPEPAIMAGWEPVFHPALDGQTVYAPGLGGSLLRWRRSDGMDLGRVSPFGLPVDPQIFVASPLTVDANGNVFYNAIQLDAANPTFTDVVGAWLVRVDPDGVGSMVSFSTLVPDAPSGIACEGLFLSTDLPWPPSPAAQPPLANCGSQRPGVNIAPAVATDGTIYTVSRAHFNNGTGYLIAVNSDLSPKWHASLRNRFHDGCNVLIPPNGTPGGCREGAATGVDPATNAAGSGRIPDLTSSSPTIAPDGSILFGVYTGYNYRGGHLMRFSDAGEYLGSYPFGWDLTPSIDRHDGTYSIVLKENHYAVGSYCGNSIYCPADRSTVTPDDPEQYLITRLDAALNVEWKFKATNTLSCTRQLDGSLDCVDDHPAGFEWCINAAAVDGNGTVHANSEDGGIYAIDRTGSQVGHHFLQLASGAAYTPSSIGDDGLIYTQNFGHLFVVGAAPDPIFTDGFE